MEMRKMVISYLVLDALVVTTIGIASIQGDHGWDFFLVNGVRLGIMASIVAFWRMGSSKWLEKILFGKYPTQE